LDAELRSLLRSNGVLLTGLQENWLVVDFEAGCARRFHAGYGEFPLLAELVGQLRTLLSAVRFGCAQRVACGEVPGPSTLAVQ
jgi:hypothetical protein